jgi:aspartate/methionine/tyrosine aminotransferase
MISKRLGRVQLSPTLKINAKARAMRAAGHDIIDFSVGEPDFQTPSPVKDAGIRAIEEGFTRYTANDGVPELKQAIRDRYRSDYGVDYADNQVMVSTGAKQCLANLLLAVLDPGQEVIVPAPYWVSYPEMVKLAEGSPVIVPTREDNGFRLTPDELRDHLNFNTKALILNSPSNPTGSVYSRAELEALCEIAVAEGVLIISDEVYERILYGPGFTSVASLGDGVRDHAVVVSGVSKAYSMTGWRIGYAAGPADIIATMGVVQSHTTSNANAIAQKAAAEALAGDQGAVGQMVEQFRTRRNLMLAKLQRIPGVSCSQPDGAFYLFPNTSSYYTTEHGGMKIRNSYGLAYYLLREAGVAVVPGSAFGADDNVRLSYATSSELIDEGMERIIAAMARLTESAAHRKVALHNVMTSPRTMVDADTHVSVEQRDALVAEADAALPYDRYHEWNANINGVVVQLRTNERHLHDFWMENWYPAQLEADLEPHVILYAVTSVAGRTPYGYYCPEMNTGVLFNTSYYGQVRAWALGMVTRASERFLDVHGLRAACVELDGHGVVLIAPKGMGRGRTFHRLLEAPGSRFVSNDFVFVRYRGREAIADAPERKFYVKTEVARDLPTWSRVFDRSLCENVVSAQADWTAPLTPVEESPLELGEPFCYWGSSESRAMVDPAWLRGPLQVAKRTTLQTVVLLTGEPGAPSVRRLEADDALEAIASGRYRRRSGAAPGVPQEQPFFNPYLLDLSVDQEDLQRRHTHQLVHTAAVWSVNTDQVPAVAVAARVRDLIGQR